MAIKKNKPTASKRPHSGIDTTEKALIEAKKLSKIIQESVKSEMYEVFAPKVRGLLSSQIAEELEEDEDEIEDVEMDDEFESGYEADEEYDAVEDEIEDEADFSDFELEDDTDLEAGLGDEYEDEDEFVEEREDFIGDEEDDMMEADEEEFEIEDDFEVDASGYEDAEEEDDDFIENFEFQDDETEEEEEVAVETRNPVVAKLRSEVKSLNGLVGKLLEQMNSNTILGLQSRAISSLAKKYPALTLEQKKKIANFISKADTVDKVKTAIQSVSRTLAERNSSKTKQKPKQKPSTAKRNVNEVKAKNSKSSASQKGFRKPVNEGRISAKLSRTQQLAGIEIEED